MRDAVAQTTAGSEAAPSPIASFDGIDSSNGASPPDPNGAVGPSAYVQAVNDAFAVYDKRGHTLLSPQPISSLWSGFGGACENDGEGDPVALYDSFADRFVLSEFAFRYGFDSQPHGPFYECIAVTKTSDPTAGWYRYAFLISDTKLDDYPKLGVWPDGYYMTMNQFLEDGTWGGIGVAVFDRTAMLAGQNASMVYLDTPTSSTTGMLPADANGWTPPPAGSPEYFVGFDLGQWGHALDLYRFHVDWTNPAGSSFTGPSVIQTAPFDADLCSYQRDCIPQPGTADGLDANSYRLMYPLVYRNFGDHESLAVTHTVDADGTDHAGVRWYEINDPAGSPAVSDQGTYAPDGDDRFTGSAGIDRSGDLALGYTVAGTGTYPSVRYAGRTAQDPPGELQAEGSLMEGTGSQTDPSYRWGDYSSMSVDPTDDCTFWYTNEYYPTTNPWTWSTRIGSFRFPDCGSSGPALSIDDVTVPRGGQSADFTVTLSQPSDQPVTVDYSTNPGSGSSDASAASGAVSFDPGQTSATVSVPVTAAGGPAVSTFSVWLSNPSGAGIDRIVGTATLPRRDRMGDTGNRTARRPDGLISGPGQGFVGARVYNANGRGQTRFAKIAPGARRVFVVKVENHGSSAAVFHIRGPHGTAALHVEYRMRWTGTNVTRKVVSGRDLVRVPRGGTRAVKLIVTAARSARRWVQGSFLVVVSSAGWLPRRDAVRATVRVI